MGREAHGGRARRPRGVRLPAGGGSGRRARVEHDLGLGRLAQLDRAPLAETVPTQVGANVLRPPPNSSLVVMGAGAVGLAGDMAANIMGCAPVIAIDLHRNRLDLAAELGATHLIDAGSGDIVGTVKRICRDGAAFCLDAVGLPETTRRCEHARNGRSCGNRGLRWNWVGRAHRPRPADGTHRARRYRGRQCSAVTNSTAH
ncbi:zinc-binding dehydrogenase [Streptomyces sp. NPDC050619]|uniref:zinc-binding dehydrogenase n=1 Tax=Streptomyces sp. NPDC050619 TaxID=3157214 RepID=UPI003440F168